MSELPQGWCETAINDITEVFLGKTPARVDYRSTGKLKVIKFRDLRNGSIDFHNSKNGFVRDNGSTIPGLRELRPRDVLITSAAHSGENIGKKCVYVATVPPDFDHVFFTGELLNIRCEDETLSRWLYFFFRSAGGFVEIQNAVSGVHLTAGRAKQMVVPLSPLNEQRRIVAKLDRLLSRMDEAQARLATIPRILKRFRQSVLMGACSGRLTSDWRRKNSDVISHPNAIEELRARISIADVPELPAPWLYTSIDALLSSQRKGMKTGPFGTMLKKEEHQANGVPVLGIENLDSMRFRKGSKIHITKDKARQLSAYEALPGDVLISRSGTVGEVCVVPSDVGEARFSTNLMRIVLSHEIMLPIFFCYLFNGSPFVLDQVRELCKGSTRDFLNQTILNSIVFPLPALTEQDEIVRRVEALFKTADALEARYRKAKAHVDKLMQSILAKAFRGELVAQDEKDESAAVLLERIRADRALRQVGPKLVAIAGRGTGRTKITPHSKGIFYRRAALDCYVIEKLEGDLHLGRTKMEKISHLMEHHCGIDLEREPIRDAAGPNDYSSRINVESLARKQKWYSTRKQEGGEKIKYLPGAEIQKSRHTAINFLGDRKATVDALLSLLRPLDTKNVEVVATLYASWNDFLLTGKAPTDDELIYDVRNNWHASKQLIPLEWWTKSLDWMRRKQLIPTGTGKLVPHKPLSERSSALTERFLKTKSKSKKKRKQRA